MLRGLLVAFTLAALACSPESQAHGVPEYGYEVVRVYPHDPEAFTQGLFYLDGFLYEGTGLPGESSIRKVKIETGEVLQKRDLPAPHFGEGIVNWNDRLLELTWEEHIGFVYDLSTFQPKGEFHFPGQGWGLTQDGKRIIMSDGTPELRFWDPESLRELGRITVTNEGQPVQNLNELEWVKGEVFANVWQSNRIVRIDPGSGRLVGWINLAGLWEGSDNAVKTLNGIAYDAATDRLFVTGKKWPKLFEIRLIRKSP
ncbi:MAG TPA: glutaminyl-peptide cyclotransferase [Bryobacteraceae bacterium]|nr:glutaminyl-peptide cyclotransferase [Bryobacteraceae bacterium]